MAKATCHACSGRRSGLSTIAESVQARARLGTLNRADFEDIPGLRLV
jgi:hypothetical protein